MWPLNQKHHQPLQTPTIQLLQPFPLFEQPQTDVPGVQFCLPTSQDAVSTMTDPTLQQVPSADPSINYANMVPSMPRFDAYGRRLW